jgi:hypothetical protein
MLFFYSSLCTVNYICNLPPAMLAMVIQRVSVSVFIRKTFWLKNMLIQNYEQQYVIMPGIISRT